VIGVVFATLPGMNARAQRLYEEALELSDEDRTKLGWELLASADVHAVRPPDEAWATEIERRIAEARAGRSRGIPVDDVIATLRAEVKTMGRHDKAVER
jgi:putative addiction module component (TIGR02574 family)